MDQQFCPYCQKITNIYLSGSERITAENAENNFKTIIIKSYSCQRCGSFIFSQQKEEKEI